jgi:hypothetical protein
MLLPQTLTRSVLSAGQREATARMLSDTSAIAAQMPPSSIRLVLAGDPSGQDRWQCHAVPDLLPAREDQVGDARAG